MVQALKRTADAGHSGYVRGAAWLCAAAVIAGVMAWQTQGLAARLVPWAWEVRLADGIAPPDAGKLCEPQPGPGQAAIDAIVQRLYPQSAKEAGMPVHVRVVKDPKVNAFAALGGQMTVLSGLIAQAQDAEELAGVLAHELEHVAQRHLIEHVAQGLLLRASIALLIGDDSPLGDATHSADTWANLQFSRGAEMDADAGAIARLSRSHIGVAGLANFFKRQQASVSLPTWLSDHPSPHDRLQMLRMAAQTPTTAPILTDAAWHALKHMCD